MNLDGCWDNLNLPQNDEQRNLDRDVIEEEDGMRTFRVKNYIPKRSARKFLEPPYIISIAIIFILIIIIIILASIKNKSIVWNCPNETTTEEVIHDEPLDIILMDKNRFFTYDPLHNSLQLLLEVKNPVQSFDIDARKTLFWVETNSSNIMSLRQFGNKTDKEINLFFDETRLKPFAVALDPINNNLYIVDESIDGVIVINVDTKYFTMMLLDLSRPRHIVLDSDKGVMFIASTEKIVRTNMDGRSFTRVIFNKAISGIALDPKREKIFWVHNAEVIEMSDYDGLYEEQVLVDSVPILNFAILDDHLFWLRKSSEDQNATLWSCKVRNGTCDDHRTMSNAFGTSTLLRVNSRVKQNSRRQEKSNRQKCEHISLTSTSGQISCACNMSSQLVFNTKCEPITQFLLYTLNNVTRSRTLDSGQRVPSEPLWPTPYRVEYLSFKTEIDFDYDFENGDFYFSEDKRINKIKLTGKSPQQEIVLVSTDDLYIEDLAYDWLTGNMYYSKRSKRSTGNHLLAVFNVKKGPRFQKILKTFDFDNTFGLEAAAYGLAVYPSRGSLYFTAGENGRRYIYQTTMNGTVMTKFTNIRYVHEYRLIAVDYDKNRLYWISSDISVSHANFDGTDRKDITSNTVQKAKTISISKQWMYLSGVDSVWRVNKENGNDYTRISSRYLDNLPKISGARIISQAQVNGNPCRKNNGGCEQFCFYGPNAICDCAGGFTVTPKGVCK